MAIHPIVRVDGADAPAATLVGGANDYGSVHKGHLDLVRDRVLQARDQLREDENPEVMRDGLLVLMDAVLDLTNELYGVASGIERGRIAVFRDL